jgi:hypothetical protein
MPAVVVFVTLKQYHIEQSLTLLVLHGTKNCTQATAAAATDVAAHRIALPVGYTQSTLLLHLPSATAAAA